MGIRRGKPQPQWKWHPDKRVYQLDREPEGIRQCLECGAPLTLHPGNRHNRKYCPRPAQCRQNAWLRRKRIRLAQRERMLRALLEV